MKYMNVRYALIFCFSLSLLLMLMHADCLFVGLGVCACVRSVGWLVLFGLTTL